MDWITGIQRAIDYVEAHLTEEIDYAEVSKAACSSVFHFQRVFGILCGMTLGEYVRGRRLTLAGCELAAADVKVIDVALKYGYDTPESFSRAFARFHGITPSQARTCGNNLKSMSRLAVKLILEGGTVMDYRIEEKKAFKVIEKVKMFSMANESNLKEIPKFWTDAHTDGTIETLCGCCGGPLFSGDILGICYGDGCKDAEQFPYSIAAGYGGGSVPEGFRVNEIPSNTWAVFPCKGAMPKAIQDLWRRIYTEFFPASDYAPKNEIDFEVYPDGDVASADYVSEIWIAVKKK